MSRRDRYANLKPGCEMVFLGTSYFFAGRTPDGRIIATTSHGQMLMMPDPDNGLPCMPTSATLGAAEASQDLVFRAVRLVDPVRQEARDEQPPLKEFPDPPGKKRSEQELSRARREAYIESLRAEVIEKWDLLSEEERPYCTETSLNDWFDKNFDLEHVIRTCGRIPCATTIRTWVRTRGRKGDRRKVDMESKRGKVPRKSRLDPTVLAAMKLVAANARLNPKTSARSAYRDFLIVICKINGKQSVKIGDQTFEFDAKGKILPVVSLTTFRKEFEKANTLPAKKHAYGKGGKRAMTRGAGKAKEPVRALELVEMDSTPLEKYFVVDVERGIPVGTPTVVIVFCVFTRCVLGVDVSFDQPSTATWFRALVHATLPKVVPKEFSDFLGLADIGGYLNSEVIADNAPENFAKAAEDGSGDLFMSLRLAGEGEPTHKPYVERFFDRLRQLLDELPGYTFNIKELRKYNFNPEKQKLITLQDYQKAVALAMAYHHVTPHDGLMGRCPLDLWQEQMAIHGLQQPKDVDQFLRSMGNPEFAIYRRNGFTVPGIKHLRYSIRDKRQHEEFMDDLTIHYGKGTDAENPGHRIKVKYYDHDVGFVSVFNPVKGTYIDAQCTMQRYAKGRTKWMHDRTVEHAKSLGRKFYGDTEEQVENALLDIHERFRAAIQDIKPQSSKEDRRKFARFLEEESTKRYLGDCVNVAFVDPSPTGMESLVEHDLRSATRRDADHMLPRSRRGFGDPLAPVEDDEDEHDEHEHEDTTRPKTRKEQGRRRHADRREIQDRANHGGRADRSPSPIKKRVVPLAPLS